MEVRINHTQTTLTIIRVNYDAYCGGITMTIEPAFRKDGTVESCPLTWRHFLLQRTRRKAPKQEEIWGEKVAVLAERIAALYKDGKTEEIKKLLA